MLGAGRRKLLVEKGCPLSSESPAVFFGPAFSTSERNLIFLSSHSLHAASLPLKLNILFYRPPVSPHGRKTPQARSHCGRSAWGRALCCGSNQALQQQLHAAAPEPAPGPTLSCCFLRTSLSFFFFPPPFAYMHEQAADTCVQPRRVR